MATRTLDQDEFKLWSASLELMGVDETERNFFLYYLGQGITREQIQAWFKALCEVNG